MRAVELQAPPAPQACQDQAQGKPSTQMLLRGLLSESQCTCFWHGAFFSLSSLSLSFFFMFVDLLYTDCQSYRKHMDGYKVTGESPVTQLPPGNHD